MRFILFILLDVRYWGRSCARECECARGGHVFNTDYHKNTYPTDFKSFEPTIQQQQQRRFTDQESPINGVLFFQDDLRVQSLIGTRPCRWVSAKHLVPIFHLIDILGKGNARIHSIYAFWCFDWETSFNTDNLKTIEGGGLIFFFHEIKPSSYRILAR